jgi:hypothetical protein
VKNHKDMKGNFYGTGDIRKKQTTADFTVVNYRFGKVHTFKSL